MIKNFVFAFFLFFTCGNIFSQELIPFYDSEKQLWGFQNKETKQIMIQPQFEHAVEWWKEYGIVRLDGKYGLIDRSGNKVSPFILDYLEVENCDGCEKKELMGIYYYRNNFRGDRKFYVNEKCECIPQPYFPCPPMVKMDTSQTAVNLKLLQKAEYWYHQGEIKASLIIAQNAIEADTNDASTSFWKANVMGDNMSISISERPERIESYYYWMCDGRENDHAANFQELEKRLSGESKPILSSEEYFIELKKLKQEDSLLKIKCDKELKKLDSLTIYYNKWEEQSWDIWNSNYDTTYHLINYYNAALRHQEKNSPIYLSTLAGKYELTYLSKTERKKIKKEIVQNTSRYDRKSMVNIMFQPAFSFFPYQKMEVNLTYGISDFMFKNVFPFMVGIGLGYDRGIELDIENYKMMGFLQPVGPIQLTLNILYSRDFDSYGIGLRPELGFSFSALTILYGFNFVSDTKFPGARGNMVGVRLNLPVWRPNEFQKTFGNNLYR